MKACTVKAEIVLRAAALILGLLLARALFAQTYIEERTFIKDGQATPRISGLISGPISGKLGGFDWFQEEPGYAQTYLGLTYSAKSCLMFAAGLGMEQYAVSETKQLKTSARAGGFVWMGNGKQYLLFVPEYGGSGFWWKLEVNRKVNKSVGIGFLTERYKGSGPRLEYRIPKTRLTIWAAPLFEKQRVNGLFGIRWNL